MLRQRAGGTWGLVWRAAGTLAAAALLVAGTVVGSDDWFPFGPFSMYAFNTPPDGTIDSIYLQARQPDGTWHGSSLDPSNVAVNRAEVEGQVRAFQANPALLTSLVQAHARLRPKEPRWTGVRLLRRSLHLRNRRYVRTTEQVLVEWTSP